MASVIYENGFRRLGAFIIDAIIISAAIKILLFAFPASSSLDDLESAFYLLGGWIYYASMESSKNQGTIGKIAVGIKVTDEKLEKISFWKATGRNFAKILSALIFFIGFLMILWTEKGQGLHDQLAHCIVVRNQDRIMNPGVK